MLGTRQVFSRNFNKIILPDGIMSISHIIFLVNSFRNYNRNR